MDELLEIYETTMTASLELKAGVLELMSTVRSMGKRIAIITEGPQDAQNRTISALGLKKYSDFIGTSNQFSCAKTSGLFPAVLSHLGITPGDMAFIGDSEERDIKPALVEGIFAIHFAETKHSSLDIDAPKISTFRKLQYILSMDLCA